MLDYTSERKINDPTKLYSFWNFNEVPDDDDTNNWDCDYDEELDQWIEKGYQWGDCE